MAKFKFSLASILNIKEKMEDLKKNEFGKALMALEAEKVRLEALIQERINCIESFRESLAQGVNPLDIKQHNNYLDNLKKRIIAQRMAVNIAEAFAEEKRKELVEAMRERKALDKLKENDYEQYLIEEKQEEQKSIDEIVSYKTATKD